MRIFTVNPGATSTKLACYEDAVELWRDSVDYAPETFAGCTTVFDQLERRSADVRACLERRGVGREFDACAGRGGLIGPVQQGAYVVNDALLDRLRHRPELDHASNLGGALALEVARDFGVPGCPAYIYDPVTVDSMMDIARITGLKGVHRRSMGHHLNMRAVAFDLATRLRKPYAESRIVVLHLGGGSSASAHADGTVVDFISDDEIQFSAERSGGVPLKELLPVLKATDPAQWGTLLRRNAGLKALCGTTDLRIVEERVAAGDEDALRVVQALGLQVAKAMATLAVSLEGRVDAFALTGGMAYSALLADEVRRRIEFIAPLYLYPGESELSALAAGALRVLRGREEPHVMTAD